MATPRTTRTKQIDTPPRKLTSEELAAAAQQLKSEQKEPLPGAVMALPSWQYDEETAQLAGKVRKKGLELAEKILDNAGSPPYTTGQLDIALRAIELYNAFK